MSPISWCLTAGFAGLVVLGFPFAIAIALAITAALLLADIEPAFLAQALISGSQQFSLLAIPLFMLAGELMTAGGLSQRLVDLAGTLVRHRTGGLAMVAVLAAVVFSAISGSAPATTAAIGSILIPAMARAGYDRGFAASIAVSAGVLGPLIPPSIAFVIWGIVAEQSIGKLFLSGVVPGLVLAAGLLVVCWAHAKRNHVPKLPKATLAETWAAFHEGKWALASPLVVLGGIYGGVFTPTEAAITNAELQLSYASIVAPVAGRIANRGVETGNYVTPGQALLSVVEPRVWVTANFKETQLKDIRPGQAVEVKVDAYPDPVLKGRVDGIQRGTGARFSVLPAQNATGNYVKITQRVPVKIVLEDDRARDLPLSPGLSVVPSVRVRD